MYKKIINLIDKKFGYLTVLDHQPKKIKKTWLYETFLFTLRRSKSKKDFFTYLR